MARDHLLVIDQGTTSTRAVLYNKKLEVVGQGQAEVLPTYPHSGWVEHDPKALIESEVEFRANSRVWGTLLHFRFPLSRPSVGSLIRPDSKFLQRPQSPPRPRCRRRFALEFG